MQTVKEEVLLLLFPFRWSHDRTQSSRLAPVFTASHSLHGYIHTGAHQSVLREASLLTCVFLALLEVQKAEPSFSLCIRCVFMNICSRRSSEDRMRGDLFSSLARWEEFSDPSTCFRFPEGEKRGKIPSCIRFCNASTITPTALAGGRTRCRRCRRQIKCFCTLTSSVFRVPSPTWAVCSILSGLF